MLTVTNSGDATSAPTTLSLGLPAGVAVSSISGDGLSVPALEPGQSTTVSLQLTVDQAAEPGSITVATDGQWMYRWLDVQGADGLEPATG